MGAIDAVVEPEKLTKAALNLAKAAAAGEQDWKAKRQPKLRSVKSERHRINDDVGYRKRSGCGKSRQALPGPS